ncbi:heavy metal translocating P-type ATPase [Marinomonas ostreistagni]|uniref:heavy metal translocating P-type ATPase n=1 Tax=Marinomonas ostreistagni TaxID=359209 RepID=UPI00194DDCC6|nr:heavy metal translocating P-type ATPase [Marinomonas ostreistagni]MBM6549929.1 cadmium-translocating P-type ATPase [Marinomonas ostreistagni]
MSQACFHCGDPIPIGLEIASDLQDARREFCCYGCQAIAEHICAANLGTYYDKRGEQNAVRLTDEDLAPFDLLNDPSLYQHYVYQEGTVHSMQLLICGITCSACAWLIEKHLAQQVGIESVHVNVSTRIASISWQKDQLSPKDLAELLADIGYHAQPYVPGERDQQQKQHKKQAIIRLGVAGVGMMQVMMSAIAMYAGDLQGMDDVYRQLLRSISFIFATPVVLYAGLPFYRGALRDLRTLHFTMDLPVSIGVLLAYVSSVVALFSQSGHVYFDSVTMFIFFLLLGRFLEAVARAYQTQSNDHAPLTAVKVKRDETLQTIALHQLQVGDIAQIDPGQSFPVDGILLSPHTSVDESSLTGEYQPVSKHKGDVIHAQTINIEQKVEFEVTHTGQNTRAAAISRITERALAEKPPVAIMADRVAHYFVIAVLVIAALTYIFWSFQGRSDAYWVMVSVLVVTCPCALSLATPVALTTATNALKQAGLLITRGHVIEALANTQHIVFDKTGTLTQGRFAIRHIEIINTHLSEDSILSMVAGLEQHSKHPIAQAFADIAPTPIEAIENLPSQGVCGTWLGQKLYFGNRTLLESLGLEIQHANIDGYTSLYLADADHVIARIDLCDALRPETQQVLTHLKQRGARLSLLTGDTLTSARAILPLELFDDVVTDCLPEQKWQWIRDQQQHNVLMVGDGLNDVPALAGATTSLAMQASSDLAKTHADAILLNDHLATLPKALASASKCRLIIKQNLIWAAGYNATLLPLAVAGLIPPWVAALGMALSSLLVVLNATRLTTV